MHETTQRCKMYDAKEKVVLDTGMIQRRKLDWLLIAILAIISLHAVYCWTVGWKQPIVDSHAFRQTQTAISCYYMQRNGLELAYETPILGPPWKIPFEFPIYSWIVVAISNAGFELESAGRLVSILSFIFVVAGTYIGLTELFPDWRPRVMVVILILSNPYYLFWSRTFMIEMTAVALGVWTVVLSVYYGRSKQKTTATVAVLVGCLAALQKITTFPAYHLCCVALLAKSWRNRTLSRNQVVAFLFGITVVPIAITKAWIHYADDLKSENPFGEMLTSSNLSSWNYGTLQEKLEFGWILLAANRLSTVIYHPFALILAALVILATWKHRMQYLSLFAGFAVTMALFTQLYGHSYYMCANLLPLLVLFGIAICHGVQEKGAVRALAIATLLSLVMTGIYRSHTLYLPLQRHPDVETTWLAKSIRLLTEEDEIVVGIGLDWSSVIPYYAERRSLFYPGTPTPDQLRMGAKLISNLKVGGLIVRVPEKNQTHEDLSRMNEFAELATSLRLSNEPIKLRNALYYFPNEKTQYMYDRLERATQLASQQKIGESLQLVESLPDSFNDGLYLRASLYFAVSRPVLAVQALKQMTKNLPGDPATWAAVGGRILEYAEHDPRYAEISLPFLDKAIEIEPLRSDGLYLLRSRARRVVGDLHGSQEDVRRAKAIPSLRILDPNGDLSFGVTS